MRWKLFTAAALGAVLMCAPIGGNVYAADNSAYEEYDKAIGLIEKCTLTCTATADGYLNISAKTQVSSVMEEVGYKNVVVQHSDDGINWKDELYLGDFIGKNTRYYSINGLRVKVKGGGEYRVVCEHYAKGIPYGGTEVRTQTAVNASSWADTSEIVTSAQTKTGTTTVSTTSTTSTTSTRTSSSTSSTGKGSTRTTDAASSSTTAAATTTAKGGGSTNSSNKTAASDAPTTGVAAPVAAMAVLAGAGAAAWTVRRKEQ